MKKKIIYRTAWAIVFDDGRMVIDADCKSEDDIWQIALGWPSESEIAHAKKFEKARAVRCKIAYYDKE